MSKNEKTRNNKRWSEGRFRGFITSILRAGTRKWPPKWDALKAAFKKQGINPKTKRRAKLFSCASCGKLFSQKDVQVDHIVPVGHCDSWNEFIEKLYCESSNLQVLCKATCHKKKTKKEQSDHRL